MYWDASSFNQPLNKWNVSKVTYMRYMFCKASSFNQPLNKWNVSNVKDMSFMFRDAISFVGCRRWRRSCVYTVLSLACVSSRLPLPHVDHCGALL